MAHDISAVLGRLAAALCSILAILGAGAAVADASTVERLCPPARPDQLTCVAERLVPSSHQARIFSPTDQASSLLAPAGYGPADIQSAYNLPTAGSLQTVAVVDPFDLPTAESDLATYRSQFGLPPCTSANGCFRKVNEDGDPTPLPAADVAWGAETASNLDMISAACPECRILLVEAQFPEPGDLDVAVDTAAALGVTAIDAGYSAPEEPGDAQDPHYNHPGIAIAAASGDEGFGASYPADSPFVTAVGGTSLSRASNARGWTETAWQDAGSGCSEAPKPRFQQDTACRQRTIADVAAVADPNTGVATYDSYQQPGWQVFGGTNVAAAIIASVYAMAQPGGNGSNELPYRDPGDLFDVTSGSNGLCGGSYLCTAMAGFDGPTGLGTPNGVEAFGPPTTGSTFSLSFPARGTVASGGTKTVTVSTATQSGSPQSLSLSVRGAPGDASFSPTTITSGDSSTLTIRTAASTAPGTYALTITAKGTSRTDFGTYTLTVPCANGGQKLVNRGFEAGTAGWGELSSHGIGVWTQEPPHSGSWDAWLAGTGPTHSDELDQDVSVPQGCTSYVLSFWLHVNTAETTTTAKPDKLTVYLDTTNGTTKLATFSNLNKISGYKRHAFNVAAFAGQDARLLFATDEDASRQTSFVIDDTALRVR